MSSKLDISERMPSGPDSWEERKEDDLDDLDPERSGGESGTMETVVISSPNTSRTGVDHTSGLVLRVMLCCVLSASPFFSVCLLGCNSIGSGEGQASVCTSNFPPAGWQND